jgi:hypothetical protein
VSNESVKFLVPSFSVLGVYSVQVADTNNVLSKEILLNQVREKQGENEREK